MKHKCCSARLAFLLHQKLGHLINLKAKLTNQPTNYRLTNQPSNQINK